MVTHCYWIHRAIRPEYFAKDVNEREWCAEGRLRIRFFVSIKSWGVDGRQYSSMISFHVITAGRYTNVSSSCHNVLILTLIPPAHVVWFVCILRLYISSLKFYACWAQFPHSFQFLSVLLLHRRACMAKRKWLILEMATMAPQIVFRRKNA